MSKKLVYRHFLGQVKDSDEISLEFDNGTISAYLEPKPKQWSGPQDGLPPVGITCERRFLDHGDKWSEMTVLCHGKNTVYYRDRNGTEWSHYINDLEFRAIRTTEQLAAEQRETSIREFMDIVGIDCRVTASKAVDAGFKREACKSDCSTNNRGVPELLGPCDCR